jgi:hypothetical protein
MSRAYIGLKLTITRPVLRCYRTIRLLCGLFLFDDVEARICLRGHLGPDQLSLDGSTDISCYAGQSREVQSNGYMTLLVARDIVTGL